MGVIRIDDLDGDPIAVAFRYSCHPVTMGPRSAVASSDFPGAARDVVERSLGGLALFLQGGGGNVNPRAGMGFEVDCRDTKNRVGAELGGEVVTVAARIRTNTRAGERRPLGNVPDILFTPWERVDGPAAVRIAAAETAVALDYVDLPLARRSARDPGRMAADARRATRRAGAQDWEVRVAEKYEDWARLLVEASDRGAATCDLFLQALRIGDVVIAGLNAEVFFESGLEIRSRSPVRDTFVLGCTNGTIGYLPRAEDHPPGGLGAARPLRRARPHLPGPSAPGRAASRLRAARRRGDAGADREPRRRAPDDLRRPPPALDIARCMVDPTIDS